MSISEEEIRKVAHLARIELHDEDIHIHAKNVSNILDLVQQMSAVDTNQVAPMSHPYPNHQPLRADVVTETNQRDVLLANAPATADGLFLVPTVID